MIKIGTYMIKDANLTPTERLRRIKDAGFDYVCFGLRALAGGAAVGVTPDFCAGLGLEIGDAHLTGSGTHALWAEGEEGDLIADRYCEEIVKCRELGVKVGVLHAVYGYSTPAPMGDIGLSRFSRIVECAEREGVTLALENSLFDEYLCYVLDNIKSPNLKYCFDSGHRHAFSRDMDFLAMYGDRLAATHLQDNDGVKDIHLMPYDGSINWDCVARSLAQCAHARDRICAEVVGVVHREMSGMSAEELRGRLGTSDAYQSGLMKISDGLVTAYEDLTFEEVLARLYDSMRRVADAIEAAAPRG